MRETELLSSNLNKVSAGPIKLVVLTQIDPSGMWESLSLLPALYSGDNKRACLGGLTKKFTYCLEEKSLYLSVKIYISGRGGKTGQSDKQNGKLKKVIMKI